MNSPSSLNGRLIDWTPDWACAEGLSDVGMGDFVAIEGCGPALVVSLRNDFVELAPCSSKKPSSDATVRPTPRPVISIGNELYGRVLTPLATPLDDGGQVAQGIPIPLFFPTQNTASPFRASRSPSKRLTTGLLVYDLNRVIPTGTAILAVGNSSMAARHILRHQEQTGTVCVYVRPSAVNQTTPPTNDFSKSLDGNTDSCLMDKSDKFEINTSRCIRIEGGRSSAVAEQWMAPWAALSIGLGFLKFGQDVLIVLDSLDTWSERIRYFPQWGSLPTQVGRWTTHAHAGDSGSLSVLALASPRLYPFVMDMFDEVLDLQSAMTGSLDVSGTKLARPPLRTEGMDLFGKAIVALSHEEDWRQTPGLYPSWGGDIPSDPLLALGVRLRRCLEYRHGMPTDTVEQLVSFVAVFLLEELPAWAVPIFVREFESRIRKGHRDVLAAIREQGVYGVREREQLMVTAHEVVEGVKNQNSRNKKL